MLDVQARMTLVGEIKNTSVNVTASMDQVSQMVPLDTKLDTFELNQGGWILKGTASSEGSFATLMSRLENSGKFTTIDVGDVRYDLRKGGLVFSVETTFPKVNAPKAAAPARRATPTPKEET
jgi:Tfp pilus assembly protein PilN